MNASIFDGAAAPVSAINITLHILTETVRQRGNRVVTNKLFTGYRLIPASACAPFVTAPAAWRPSPRSATALVSRGQLVAERRTRLFLIMDACKRLPATAAGSGMPVNCYRRDTPPSLHHARIDGVERARRRHIDDACRRALVATLASRSVVLGWRHGRQRSKA